MAGTSKLISVTPTINPLSWFANCDFAFCITVIESQNVGFHQHLSALYFRNTIQENEYVNAYVFHSTAMKHVASGKIYLTHEECELKF